jgi:hypothetical protein
MISKTNQMKHLRKLLKVFNQINSESICESLIIEFRKGFH